MTRARAAASTFGLLLVAGLALYIVVGRDQWFFSDDWEFIAGRSLSRPLDLFRPFNGHWMLVPTVYFRALFSVFHLSSYLAYLLPVMLLQLCAAWLLRVIMRRAGVGPWTATLGGAVVILLGSTYETIFHAVQFSYLFAVVCGLGQLVLANHDGPINRRDFMALGIGFLAIMSSGVSIPVVGATTLAVLLRRGWRPALLQAGPLAAVYLTWSVMFGDAKLRPGGFAEATKFVVIGLDAGLRSLGQIPGATILLLALLIVGLIIAARRAGFAALLERSALRTTSTPIALLVAAVAFMVITALGRAGPFGAASASTNRFAGVVALLVLPAVALAATVILRRFPRAGIVGLLVLAMGIPGNVLAFGELVPRAEMIAKARAVIVALPDLPGADLAPDDMKPLPESLFGPAITMGFLRTAVASGWLKSDPVPDADTRAIGVFHLSLRQHFSAAAPTSCAALISPVTLELSAGQELLLAGGFVTVTDVSTGASPLATGYFNPNRGNSIGALGHDMTLQLSSQGTNGAGYLCKNQG